MGRKLKGRDELKEQVINVLSSPDVVGEIRKIVLGILREESLGRTFTESGDPSGKSQITIDA